MRADTAVLRQDESRPLLQLQSISDRKRTSAHVQLFISGREAIMLRRRRDTGMLDYRLAAVSTPSRITVLSLRGRLLEPNNARTLHRQRALHFYLDMILSS